MADRLLQFDDRRATEAVAATLDLRHWAGGNHLGESVHAVFKLDPRRAFDHLEKYFDQVSKAPEAHSIPGQQVFNFLLDELNSRDPDDRRRRKEIGIPSDIVAKDLR